ncbi:MAG: DUF5995 family protein [Candidatus Cohnella colombiensis]|uniref:DUF5995 family protein n=1 Tax=Candidatus Cohnella colombiensis TaxID=3121368 RepID=A0AA95JFS1_9BACL|nr:MAG: DUF5995 family protein [Cohnella sp.]
MNITQVIEEMTVRLQALEQHGDHRVVFQRVYLLMTKEMKRRLEDGFFHDSEWMERVLVGFAQYYFEALDAYEKESLCPPAWKLALAQAQDKRGFVLQDALLGINAHINSDLPLVLHAILDQDNDWSDSRVLYRRRQDHDRINDVLSDLVDQVQNELAQHYARLIGMIDWMFGRKDEALSSFILAHCRTTVWTQTESLLNASDHFERDDIRHQIEQGAYAIGRRIVDSRPLRLMKGIAPLTRRYRWF